MNINVTNDISVKSLNEFNMKNALKAVLSERFYFTPASWPAVYYSSIYHFEYST